MVNNFQRILIIRTDRVGDVILTLPMAKILKQKFLNTKIVMLIRQYTKDLVEDYKYVDEIILYDDGKKPIQISQIVKKLRTYQFDAVIHTNPRLRQALITWWAGIPIRIGTGYRGYSFLFTHRVYDHRKDAKQHELIYNLNLLKPLGCEFEMENITPTLEIYPQSLEKVNRILTENSVQSNDRIVILHPGSGGSARDWSPKKFGELGKKLSNLENVKIIITGKKDEEKIINEVRNIIGSNSIAFVNKFSLKELAALSKLSSLVIANSTGPIHIAAAVGTPVVGLYSQVVPLCASRWAPYTEKKIIITPKDKPIDCKLCEKKKITCECMESISVDEVYQAAISMLNRYN